MTPRSTDTLIDVLHFANGRAAIGIPELGIVVTYESLRQQVLAMADALASEVKRKAFIIWSASIPEE